MTLDTASLLLDAIESDLPDADLLAYTDAVAGVVDEGPVEPLRMFRQMHSEQQELIRELLQFAGWTRGQSKTGNPVWISDTTGERRYQDKEPNTRQAKAPEAGPVQPHADKLTAMHDALTRLNAADVTPQMVQQVTGELVKMSREELHGLRDKLGLPLKGLKSAVKGKLAQALLAKVQGGKPNAIVPTGVPAAVAPQATKDLPSPAPADVDAAEQLIREFKEKGTGDPAEIIGHLTAMKMPELRELQKRLSLKGGRSKEQVARQAVDRPASTPASPPDAVTTPASGSSGTTPKEPPAGADAAVVGTHTAQPDEAPKGPSFDDVTSSLERKLTEASIRPADFESHENLTSGKTRKILDQMLSEHGIKREFDSEGSPTGAYKEFKDHMDRAQRAIRNAQDNDAYVKRTIPVNKTATQPAAPEHFVAAKPSRHDNQQIPEQGRPKLAAKEKKAARDYAIDAFTINSDLRAGAFRNEEVKQQHEQLQKAFSKTPAFDKPVQTYRIIDTGTMDQRVAKKLADLYRQGAQSGEAFTDPAYLSTTTDPQMSALKDEFWGKEGSMEVSIAARHGLDLSPLADSTHNHVSELLLNAGSRYRVASFSDEGGKIKVQLEQLPHEDTAGTGGSAGAANAPAHDRSGDAGRNVAATGTGAPTQAADAAGKRGKTDREPAGAVAPQTAAPPPSTSPAVPPTTTSQPGTAAGRTQTAPAKPEHISFVASAVGKLVQQHRGIIPLTALKQATGMSTPELHAAVNDLRRQGILTTTAHEKNLTPEDREVGIPDPSGLQGFVSVRHGQESELAKMGKAKPSQNPSGGGKPFAGSPMENKTPSQMRQELLKNTQAEQKRRGEKFDPNPWKIQPAGSLDVMNSILGTVTDSLRKNSFDRPDLRRVYEATAAAHTGLTVPQFQAAIVQMVKDGKLRADPYTQSINSFPEDRLPYSYPMDGEIKSVLDVGSDYDRGRPPPRYARRTVALHFARLAAEQEARGDHHSARSYRRQAEEAVT
jgi:hypothetical protein